MTIRSKKKVVLGLSGGVDSAAAALLLKEEGYDVLGLFFSVVENCNEELKDAEKAAQDLEIPLIHRHVAKEFHEKIIVPFCEDYAKGRTPNPCTLCNPSMKFRILWEEAQKQNADYIATGHYANKVYLEKWQTWAIKQGKNQKKDQSYMLYGLDSIVIKRLLLPLGDWHTKEKVRSLAQFHQLENAQKKDSQEICFIDTNYQEFLKEEGYSFPPGDFVDQHGTFLGKHKGLGHYTVGQRKGLGIALGKPVFVLSIDREKNQVVLGNHEELFQDTVTTSDFHFVVAPEELLGHPLKGKIRYAGTPQYGKISQVLPDKITFVFEEKQRAVTPGQSIVFYEDDVVLGGGTID